MRRKGKSGFPGGIHPTDGRDKLLTMNQSVRVYHPEIVTILSDQSFGGRCGFQVTRGDSVEEGTIIGVPETFTAAFLHASVGGSVVEVKEIMNLGQKGTGCIIQRTEEAETAETVKEYETELVSLDSYEREQIIKGLEQGGVTGMGGAGFPAYRKYETEKRIDTLLVNGVECEPYLTCDYRLMLECGYALANGIRLLLSAAGADNACLCIEDNKPKAIEQMRRLLKEERRIEVRAVPTKYPQGGERQLIQTVLGREVPLGGLPADSGVIVSNVATAKAAADMLLGKKPLTKRIVTVTGCVSQPGNYLVPIGTSAKELLELCGGVTAKHSRIIAGGPMTGVCAAVDWDQEQELFYVTKSTSGILVLEDAAYEEQPCIRCGGCEKVCPAGLVPYQIEAAYGKEAYTLCAQLYADACIGCGCCLYTCPARRELAAHTMLAREYLKKKGQERAVAKG